MKAFSEQGVFWLLDSPSNRAPGVLNYDPASGITLDLMEEFGEPPGHYIMDEPGYIHYIFGILKTYKGVLLESCLISYGGDDNDYVSSWSASYIYVNEHFSVDIIGVSGDLLFDKIIIEIPLLLQWVGVSGLGCEQDLEDPSKVAAWFEKPNEIKAVAVWFEKPNEIKASTETGNEVGFDFIGTFQNSAPSEMKLTQTTRFFCTSKNACNWTYMLGHIEAIARLLSVVFDEKVSPSRVRLRQAGEWEYERLIEIFFRPTEYAEEIESREEINRIYRGAVNRLGQMSYAALGGMSFVTKWLEIADKNYFVLSKLMSCKFGSMPYIDDKFHLARSAIEAYWVTRWDIRNDEVKPFSPSDKLLVDLVNEAGFSDVLEESPGSWASSVEANRNGYSSHFQRINQPMDGEKIVKQTDCLYYLTVVLLLKDAGVEDSVLDGVRNYVKRRLRSIQFS